MIDLISTTVVDLSRDYDRPPVIIPSLRTLAQTSTERRVWDAVALCISRHPAEILVSDTMPNDVVYIVGPVLLVSRTLKADAERIWTEIRG